MKKYNHFLNEIECDIGQLHFGVFMKQMVVLLVIVLLGLILLK